MSMEECNLCGKEILTEADNHALILIPDKNKKVGPHWEVNCGCYFIKEAKQHAQSIIKDTNTIAYMEDDLEIGTLGRLNRIRSSALKI